MKVFLTGGTGYVGAHIVKELLAAGHDLTILSRTAGKDLATGGVSFVKGNLHDRDLIAASLPGHQALIHNAISWDEDTDELELADTRAAAKLFEAAAQAGVEHTVYTSSTAVHRPFSPRMDEEDPIRPNDSYGATKAAAELFLSAASHQHAMRGNVLRLGPVVGAPASAGAAFKSDQRFLTFATAARAGEDIRVVQGEGRQFIGAPDAAQVFRAVLESNLNRQTFVCVAQDFVTWEQIARDVVLASESESRVVVEAAGAAPSGRFDVAQLERQFGFRFESQPWLGEHIRHAVRSLER